jgi:5'-nucleotidase
VLPWDLDSAASKANAERPVPASRPLILITNDDGYDAPGLQALIGSVAALGRVVVAAPDREQSGASHALTLDRPLRVQTVAEDRYRIDGTPTDCVHLAVDRLCGRLPDLVLSGINRGLNVGDDVTYSGTVAGALEGALLRIPAIAVSAALPPEGPIDYTQAARIACRIAERILADGLTRGTLLNVNVPAGPAKGIRVTRQGTREYRATAVERTDPAGRPYYWIADIDMTPTGEPDGDHTAAADGFISISPLHTNMTHERSLESLENWVEELL